MPTSLHPQAIFDPIPPDLDLSSLVENTPNFDYAVRVSFQMVEEIGFDEFARLVQFHVVTLGRPLVVEGLQKKLPPWLFNPAWLEDNLGKKRKASLSLTPE
jgi:hypothetical protein